MSTEIYMPTYLHRFVLVCRPSSLVGLLPPFILYITDNTVLVPPFIFLTQWKHFFWGLASRQLIYLPVPFRNARVTHGSAPQIPGIGDLQTRCVSDREWSLCSTASPSLAA